jgi:hypothetical protein
MSTGRVREAWLLLTVLVAFAPASLGDAPCNNGYRDTTPAERARITAALQAAKDALPPAPKGWQFRGDDQFSVPASLCQDGEKLPWHYSFTRSYGQVGDYEARQKIMQDAAAAAAATQAKNQARLDALQAQVMSIMQKQMTLNQKQDYAGAEKLQPQLEKVQADYEKLLAAGNEQIEAAGRAFNRDLEMSISVQMNAGAQRPGRDATLLPAPAGAVKALRWKNDDPAANDEYALVLFGPWKQDPNGHWRPGVRAGVPPSGAHAVSVYIIADRDRLADMVQQVDFAKIAAIVR